jgi:UDP-3-O-[3-hydroxymyristoyl] glucosamine N-acyltransferase
VGEHCLLNPGAVIGSEGFGFAPDPASGWVKVPQVGAVHIGNDVEIGACTTIDRGAIGDTVIEDGVKLDNQIQIAHNVRIGAHTAMAAFVGVSGSTTIGSRCLIAGQVGIGGHLTICDNVMITGKSMVSSSIRKPGVYSSSLPLDDARKFRRNAARFGQLDELAKELKNIGKKLGIKTNPRSSADDPE